jgi:hypothetical protein
MFHVRREVQGGSFVVEGFTGIKDVREANFYAEELAREHAARLHGPVVAQVVNFDHVSYEFTTSNGSPVVYRAAEAWGD